MWGFREVTSTKRVVPTDTSGSRQRIRKRLYHYDEKEEEEVIRQRERHLAILHSISENKRGTMWQMLSGACDLFRCNRGLYSKLALRGQSEHEIQISRDVTRTMRCHPLFSDEGGVGQKALFNVLKAYSLYDKEVGYTQGMGFVAAVLLLHMEEEDAFWTFVALLKGSDGTGVKQPLRGLYLPGLPLLNQCHFQMGRLLEEQLPTVAAHLRREKVHAQLYATQWFMTLFAYRFPLRLVVRIWDLMVFEGVRVLFQLGLAIFTWFGDKLIHMDFEDILNQLEHPLDEALDADRLLDVMCAIRVTDTKLEELKLEYEATSKQCKR